MERLKPRQGGKSDWTKQAEAIVASESGQSYNQKVKDAKNYDRFGERKR